MAEPFLSEIRIMSFDFAPKGWAMCNGQFLPINQNQALFSLLGTTYGGNGTTTFALPNLQGRIPIHMGSGHSLGEQGGELGHTLSIAEIPAHVHLAMATNNAGAQPVPATAYLAGDTTATPYLPPDNNLVPLAAGSLASVGGSQPHPNMQPFLALNFSIALQGIFPSQN